ncbi:hypothetical protein ABW387_07980 [Snodgrassella alvi]|uniref:hypothetical protein n=1 Tax=Snodgrassella alvi TaxID=1196083 RepID=UPI0034604F7E
MQAFYYVDGATLNGQWIDLKNTSDLDDVREALADGSWIERDADGSPDYSSDLLVADTERELADCFYSRYGSFNLEGFIEALDSGYDSETIATFI